MNNLLTPTDRKFLRHAMRYFSVPTLKLEWDESKKTYPDIWISSNGSMPKISVTKEWLRQAPHEKRKRLVHELIHVSGLEHDPKIKFETHPKDDKFSWVVYKDILNGTGKFDKKRFGL